MKRSPRPSRSPAALSDVMGKHLDTVTELIVYGLEAQRQSIEDLDSGLARKPRGLFDHYLSRVKV